jgi:hypothetical protein
MKFSVIPVLGSACIVALVIGGQTPPPPPSDPPSLPTGYFTTSTNGTVTLLAPVKKEYEWELTFVWYADTAFTNGVKYPITVQVPFVHDKGFVKVNARQKEIR